MQGYNSYVEAYNTLGGEYNNLRDSVPASTEAANAPAQVQRMEAVLLEKEEQIQQLVAELAAKEMEMAAMVQEVAQEETGDILEKDIEIQRLTALLEEKEADLVARATEVTTITEELVAVKEEMMAKEAELVAKTGDLARLCIKSQLSRLTLKVPEFKHLLFSKKFF